jgi:hypothetical protein
MANTGKEKKRSREERVPAALAVSLNRGTRFTRDVSVSGVFFEVGANYVPGSEINFVIELHGPAGKMILECRGRIVRVEDRGGNAGVAVKIIESRLQAVN